MSDQTWELFVDRTEFREALKTAGLGGKVEDFDSAILTFDHGELTIELLDNAASVRARGDWPGEVRLDGKSLDHLDRLLPDVDPLAKIEGERMFVASFSLPCESRVSPKGATHFRELIPPNPDLFDFLVVGSRCSPDEIEAAGVSALVSSAQRKLDLICPKAATNLSAYRVSALDLRKICEGHAADRTRHFWDVDSRALSRIASAWSLLAPIGVQLTEIKALLDSRLRNAWKTPK